MARTGFAQSPLHNASAPRYLFERMVPLARENVIFLISGRIEALRRLSDPYWFQAFGCVLDFAGDDRVVKRGKTLADAASSIRMRCVS
jgi:hypothetical protein